MTQGELLRYVIATLERLSIPYMVVGSFASGVLGEPRMTQDIDLVVEIAPQQVRPLCEAFPEDQFYVSREAAMDAVRRAGQFNVIHPTSGNKVDFMIARSDAWGREQMRGRRRMRVLPDQEGFVARAEDIIISKMLYYQEGGSEKHLRDIAGILKVSVVDREYVERWAKELGVSEVWEAIVRRVGG